MSADVDLDLLVLGAGPTGLYATYYAGFRELRVGVLDALPEVGGQVSALYPEKAIHDVAGFRSVRGAELVGALRDQAEQANPRWLLGRNAVSLQAGSEHVQVRTAAGETIRAGALLITAGIGSFTPRELPVGSEYLGRGLRYFVPRLHDLAEQDVVVVGGGDSAVDWALALEPVARSVALVHRRPQFRAHERSVRQVQASSVQVLAPYEVSKIGAAKTRGRLVRIDRSTRMRRRCRLRPQPASGPRSAMNPSAATTACAGNSKSTPSRLVTTTSPTLSVPGDIATYDGKVALISIGFGEAALAVNHIAAMGRPGAPLVPGHSSDL